MLMSVLMVTSPITVALTQSALTPWGPLLVLANQVLWQNRVPTCCHHCLVSGFTSWAAHSGCRDINECCVGSYAECSHTCTRTSATTGLCINNAGSYTCGSCSTAGTSVSHTAADVSSSLSQHSFRLTIPLGHFIVTVDGMVTPPDIAMAASSGLWWPQSERELD